MDVDRASHVVPPGSSAQRRRLRRLRSWWRHERQDVTARQCSASVGFTMSFDCHADRSTGDRTRDSSTCCHSCSTRSSVRVRDIPIAPATAMTYAAPSEQLPPAYTMTTVTTYVKFAHYWFGKPAIFHCCSGGFCATGRWFTSSFVEFDAPVYNQFHQEQIVAGEMTQNIVENPAVQEQLIVQEIPQVGTNC